MLMRPMSGSSGTALDTGRARDTQILLRLDHIRHLHASSGANLRTHTAQYTGIRICLWAPRSPASSLSIREITWDIDLTDLVHALDLLWDRVKLAHQVMEEYVPQVQKSGFMNYWKEILEN